MDAPSDRQLDEVHQVLAAVADGAGLKALTLTGSTPAQQEVSSEEAGLTQPERFLKRNLLRPRPWQEVQVLVLGDLLWFPGVFLCPFP